MPDRRVVIVFIEGGIARNVEQPPDVDVHIIDFDTEGAEPGELCVCEKALSPHFHAEYLGEPEGANELLEACKAAYHLIQDGQRFRPLGTNEVAEQLRAAIIKEEPELCAVCKVRPAVAGVYCQPCLDRETEGMGSDELF